MKLVVNRRSATLVVINWVKAVLSGTSVKDSTVPRLSHRILYYEMKNLALPRKASQSFCRSVSRSEAAEAVVGSEAVALHST